jgi:hypothetical protein
MQATLHYEEGAVDADQRQQRRLDGAVGTGADGRGGVDVRDEFRRGHCDLLAGVLV